jgi:hypothetical protein
MGDSIVLLYVFMSLLVLAAATLGFFLGYLFFIDRHRNLLDAPAAPDESPSRREIAISFMRWRGFAEHTIGLHMRETSPYWLEAEEFADRFFQVAALRHAAKKGA